MTTDSQVVDAKPVEALARQEPQTQALAPQALPPAVLLSLAVQQGADTHKLKELMDLQDRNEAKLARLSYEAAMAHFQTMCPVVIRTGWNTHLKVWYPQSDTAHEQIRPALDDAQLRIGWDITRDEKDWIEVAFIVSHGPSGHREIVKKGGPIDVGAGRNAIQARKSTASYLKTETMFLGLGLRSRPPKQNEQIPEKVTSVADPDDDDGQGAGKAQQPPKPKSASLTDPAEKDARLEFGKIVRARANAPAMGNDIVKVVYLNIQKLSGLSSVSDCLNWLRGNKQALIDASGNVTDVGLSSDDFDDAPQTSAAATGPTSPEPSPEPATQPPSSDELPFACDECLQRFKVKPASHKGKDGKRCYGTVAEVK